MKREVYKKLYCLMMGMLVSSGLVMAAGFTDNGDTTVSDLLTGLIWQQEDNNTTYTWENAIDYCENLTQAGQSDWRLPNIRELESIAEAATFFPAINITYFSNTNFSYYWSSTTQTSSTSDAGGVDFSLGYVKFGYKSNSFYVRCVRGGQ